MRIVLAGAVLFLVVWMVALRPGGEEEVPAPAAAPNVQTGAPAVSAPGKTVEQAQAAADAAAANAAASAGEANPAVPELASGSGKAPQPATVKTEAPKVDKSSGLPLSVLRAIADKKVLVMLFWNPKAADDRAVRRELRHVKGKGIFKHVANVKSVSRYASITRGVNLAQSPTVVVVDRKLRATPMTGFVDTSEIRQAVADAKRVR